MQYPRLFAWPSSVVDRGKSKLLEALFPFTGVGNFLQDSYSLGSLFAKHYLKLCKIFFPVKTNLFPGFRGLSSAIALSKLPRVEVTIYEQARELREIGAGIQIGYNCWKVLELLDAAATVRGHVQETITHRCFKSLPPHKTC